MAYYPKTKIQTGLFTNGGMVKASDLSPYVGPYYKLSTGQKYIGTDPQAFTYPTQLLDPLELGSTLTQGIYTEIKTSTSSTGSVNKYVQNLEENPTSQKVPIPYYPQPTSQSYQVGYFTRYFAKQANDTKFIEIDQTTFENLSEHNNEYLWQLYNATELPWQISGSIENVFKTNRNIVKLEEKNGFMGLSRFLNENYIKFYQGVNTGKDLSMLTKDKDKDLRSNKFGDMK
jgi:hypothetical protein